MSEDTTARQPSKLPLLIAAAAVVMVVLVMIAVVAARSPATYEPGTPQAALQTFVQAALDGDETVMVALLTPGARTACEDELENNFRNQWSTNDVAVELDELTIDGDRAEATVKFRRSNSNDPFDSSRWSYDERFTLLNLDDEWFIDRAGWPSPFAWCTREDR